MIRLRSIAVLASAVIVVAPPALVRAQSATGFVATWNDGETWTRATPDGRATETGVGLQPTGPDGTMPLAFVVRYAGRLTAPPSDVMIEVAVSPGINPAVLHTPTLQFTVGAADGRRETLNWSSRLTVDQPGAGANTQSGIAHIPAALFVKLLPAETLDADLLGIRVRFRASQVDAIRAFAQRVKLAPEK